MHEINIISEDDLFAATSFKTLFHDSPIGFMDIGSAGGIHPLILPLASITNCLCFEANPEAESVRFENRESPFARLTACNAAISDSDSQAEFYITKSGVNSSLLKPDEGFVKRYAADGFQIVDTITVRTQTLDTVLKTTKSLYDHVAEIIKLDCQGTEFQILSKAEAVLSDQCLALWCEVEFLDLYRGQKNSAEIDRLLRAKGFTLYGLWPNYISTKKLDRTRYDTDERLMWADAFYVKDPLEQSGKKEFTDRQVGIIILTALALHYYDFATELIQARIQHAENKRCLLALTQKLALQRAKNIEGNLDRLIQQCEQDPARKFLYAKKFIDDNAGNNNLNFLTISSS